MGVKVKVLGCCHMFEPWLVHGLGGSAFVIELHRLDDRRRLISGLAASLVAIEVCDLGFGHRLVDLRLVLDLVDRLGAGELSDLVPLVDRFRMRWEVLSTTFLILF